MKTPNAVWIATALATCIPAMAQDGPQQPVERKTQSVEVVLASDVEWTHLNPKRGDLAPKAGTLWGDRNGTGPTGFLLKPPVDFKSPPHIHNVSYRGIVIKGVIHNDDPDAAAMWMPAGSFWTQPKGEIHITAAKESDRLAYIEIEKGPYLVLPAEKAFDSGERPVNVDRKNIVWLDASDIRWLDPSGRNTPANGPKVAFLWGSRKKGELSGAFLKLPGGFSGRIASRASTFRAVVIKGRPTYALPAGSKVLEPGSTFHSKGKAIHQIAAGTGGETILYVRTDGEFRVGD